MSTLTNIERELYSRLRDEEQTRFANDVEFRRTKMREHGLLPGADVAVMVEGNRTSLGATPEDWTHFADTLGLREHLLPVVSDTSVPIHENSKLSALGKTPSRMTGDEKAVGFPAWGKHVATAREIKRWSSDGRHGICMQARAVRAIDIDIDDRVNGSLVREFALGWLREQGLAADVRQRNGTGKCLIPVRVEGALRKRILKTAHGAIEFLADGQQWIAMGTHPSGNRYEWVEDDGMPIVMPSVFPVLTIEQFEVLWSALREQFEAEEYRENEAGMVPTKPRTLADARAANDDLAAWMVENGWSTEWENDGKLRIRCPFGDEHGSGEIGDGSTVYFPAGTGGFERGHFRCLHAHCAGRKDGDYIARLGYLNDDFEVIEAPPVQEDEDGAVVKRPAGLTVNSRTGQIEPDLKGIVAALSEPSWSGVCVVFDRFSQRTYVRFAKRAAPTAWAADWLDGFEELNDDHISSGVLELVDRSFKEPSTEKMHSAVRHLRRVTGIDSAQSWLHSLQWDGTPRINRFFADYWHCADDDEYLTTVSRYFWLALAGRVLWPGATAHMMPVVKGAQGCGKSRGAAACVGESIDDTSTGLYSKMNFSENALDDAVLYMQGRLVIEFAELAGLGKRESETVKDFLSKDKDTYRMRFDRTARDWPRRCVFIGTTNVDNYLTDTTGNRRWLPMDVRDGERVDVPRILADHTQLWAEARVLLADGAKEGRAILGRASREAEDAGQKHDVHTARMVENIEEAVLDDALSRPADRGRDVLDSYGRFEAFGPREWIGDWPVKGGELALAAGTRKFDSRSGAAMAALGLVGVRMRFSGKQERWWITKEMHAAYDAGTLREHIAERIAQRRAQRQAQEPRGGADASDFA